MGVKEMSRRAPMYEWLDESLTETGDYGRES